jgi:hypothetical protein
VGINVWLAAGGAAWILARFVPAGKAPEAEAIATFVMANLAGVAATALDFGGWKEPDWRAGLFVFFCVAAALAIVRLVRLSLSAAS